MSNKDCSQKSKLAKDPQYVCNPLTGRWIKIGGKVHKKIILGSMKPKIPIVMKTKPQSKLESIVLGDQSKVPIEYKKYAETLLKDGVVVIPVISEKDRPEWNQKFANELVKFPEYLNPTLSTIYVYGGFGALGNPASFHNSFVRLLRIKMMFEAIKLFHFDKRNLEQLFDRMCIRRKGTSTTAEAWHRDISPGLAETDDIFGGWINLDIDKTQYFSCVPGTHLEKGSKTGFAKIEKADVDIYKNKKQKISILPGHWVIFYQNIVHEVIPRKMDSNSYRVYLGFRLTPQKNSLYDNDPIIANQSVPLLPGGMRPPMYAAMNVNFHLKQLIEWSASTFKEKCLEMKKKKKTSDTYKIVQRYMKSLKEYDFPLYPQYTEFEKSIMKPQREWLLP